MKTKSFNRMLFSFLDNSPTPFHATGSMAKLLKMDGFIELDEKEKWEIKKEQSYYTIRDDGALVAFNLGKSHPQPSGFRIVGAHSDSPCLQIKPQADIIDERYHKIGVEVYGGPLLSPWFDRELSIAGRVCYTTEKKNIKTKIIDFKKPVAIIPSLAIHFDRDANKKKTINPQVEINLLFGLQQKTSHTKFHEYLITQIEEEHGEDSLAEIFAYDLFCYDVCKSGYAGINNEFIVGSRLDNLLSCFVAIQSLISADKKNNFMFVCNNHEEVGSTTNAGAQGNLVSSIFERLMPDPVDRQIQYANSFFISVDNAHAYHPNYADKSDPAHKIKLNHGPVLKINANKRYATTSFSNGIFKLFANEVKVPVQEFVMRNDIACGSTIGPMTSAKLGINTVDVGAASLAMHSIREVTGSKDPYLMYKVIKHFLQKTEWPVITS